MARVIRVRYEDGVLKPLEPVQLREGEELLVRIEAGDRRSVVDKFYGRRGRLPKELIDEVLLEAELQ